VALFRSAREEKKPHSRLCGSMERVRVSQLTGMSHYAHPIGHHNPMLHAAHVFEVASKSRPMGRL
jgi:hypothetical protein